VHVLRDPLAGETPTAGAAWLTFAGSDPVEAFGADADVGDFNGDGCADVAVGAPGFDLNATNPPGRVYVFHGPFAEGTISVADADVVLEGAADWDFFGLNLAVGDYDGDGVDDLAVAAPYDSTLSERGGAVYVLADP
jgi:hypothetical protein